MMDWLSLVQALLVPILTAVGGWLAGQIKANKEKAEMQSAEWKNEHKSLLTGMAIMLREQIETIYDNYKESDSVPFDIKEELDDIYKTYKDLGGNHRGDTMYQLLNKKKIK